MIDIKAKTITHYNSLKKFDERSQEESPTKRLIGISNWLVYQDVQKQHDVLNWTAIVSTGVYLNYF